jgi:DNA polymerase III psi subunit
MGFENFKLPTALVPELYGDVLIGSAQPEALQEANQERAFAALGNNEKNVLLLVNDPQSVFVGETDLAFLTGIINACQLNLSDISIVNTASYTSVDYNKLWKQFNPSTMICFGIQAESIQLKSSIQLFQVQKIGIVNILLAPSLSELASQVEYKKKLWHQLKTIFRI